MKTTIDTDVGSIVRSEARRLLPGVKRFTNLVLLIPTLMLLLVCNTALAGMSLRPSVSGYRNEFGLGVSYGIKLKKDAMFWGVAPDYVRVLGEKWLLNASFAYDEETEFKEGGNGLVKTWTPTLMIGYNVTPRLVLGAGAGHGLIENKNGGGWKTVKFGDDFTVAGAFAVSLWSKDRHGLSVSVSIEHNISDNEPAISTDIGYGWGW